MTQQKSLRDLLMELADRPAPKPKFYQSWFLAGACLHAKHRENPKPRKVRTLINDMSVGVLTYDWVGNLIPYESFFTPCIIGNDRWLSLEPEIKKGLHLDHWYDVYSIDEYTICAKVVHRERHANGRIFLAKVKLSLFL